MPTLNQKGAVQFIVLIILLIGLIGGVFLATREEPFKLFPKASVSAPIPAPTPIPGKTFILTPPPGSLTPTGSGSLTVSLQERTKSGDYMDNAGKISGSLANMQPNKQYDVWFAAPIGDYTSTGATTITTDSSGKVTFSEIPFYVRERISDPVKTISIAYKFKSGEPAPDGCSQYKPCLSAAFSFSSFPLPTPSPTSVPTSTPIPLPTPAPSPIPPGAYQRVFITSTSFDGNLGGLAGADVKCQDRANAAGLGGSWKAWLSDKSTSAYSRLEHGAMPYKLINGTTIANNWADLTDGTLHNKINITELNTTLEDDKTRFIFVWTNTKGDGSIDNTRTCIDWTSRTAYLGGTGYNKYYKSPNWTDFSEDSCWHENHLYCFEQTAVLPSPTPTPAPNPDFLVNNISVLGTPKVGRVNSLNVAVENKGDMEAKSGKGISIGVTITKPNGTSLGTCSGTINRILKPQEKTTVQIRNCPKYTVSGNHQITATVDSTKSISESNEDNNTLSTSVVVIR